jgi:hypothetical protein
MVGKSKKKMVMRGPSLRNLSKFKSANLSKICTGARGGKDGGKGRKPKYKDDTPSDHEQRVRDVRRNLNSLEDQLIGATAGLSRKIGPEVVATLKE